MNLFTLDKNFLRTDVVDDFTSCIWTERYSTAGDVALVVPLTKENVKKFPLGVFLGESDTDEIMYIETTLKDVDAGTLKCTGPSLVKFLENRVIRTTGDPRANEWTLADNDRLTPAAFMGRIVYECCCHGGAYTSDLKGYGPPFYSDDENGSEVEAIDGLSIGYVDTDGSASRLSIAYQPVYDALASLAQTYGVGFMIYLESADEDGYSLKFKAYYGKNRTRNQTDNALVQFSYSMDTLMKTTELHSIAGYKNVVYTNASDQNIDWENDKGPAVSPGAWYADNGYESRNFDRRVKSVNDTTLSDYGGPDIDSPSLSMQTILSQRARENAAGNRIARIVDGEIPPNSPFKFKQDYYLGDIVELEYIKDRYSTALVTEYIRTQDQTGERDYPTLEDIALPPPSIIT